MALALLRLALCCGIAAWVVVGMFVISDGGSFDDGMAISAWSFGVLWVAVVSVIAWSLASTFGTRWDRGDVE